jgi:ATP-dependent DNA helicase RecG
LRPTILDPLFAPLSKLSGVGPRLTMLFDRLLEHPQGQAARLIDLLFHIPYSGVDRSISPSISDAPYNQVVTFKATVESHQKSPRHRGPFRVTMGCVFQSAPRASRA